MGKPKKDIPKINLYQKRKVCFIVSDKGDALFVELSPQRRPKNQVQPTEKLNLDSRVPSDVDVQSTQEVYFDHSRTKLPIRELEKIFHKLQEKEISQPSSPVVYRIDIIVEILSQLPREDFSRICLKCLHDQKVKRDKIRSLTSIADKAEELCEFFDTPSRGLEILIKYISQCDGKLGSKIIDKLRDAESS